MLEGLAASVAEIRRVQRDVIEGRVERIAAELAAVRSAVEGRLRPTAQVARPVERTSRPATPTLAGDLALAAGERRIIAALAEWAALGVAQPSRAQVAFVACYSPGGTYNNLLGRLRSSGLVDYPAPDCVGLTPAGVAVAPAVARPMDRAALLARIDATLRGEPLRRVFAAVVAAGEATREAIGAATGYAQGGTFNNLLGKLRTLGLIDYPSPGRVALSALVDGVR